MVMAAPIQHSSLMRKRVLLPLSTQHPYC